MPKIIFQRKYPNVIIFTHNDMDGIFSAMIIKNKYDNNLANNQWERNVQTYICSYNDYYNLDYFKNKIEQNYQEDMQNIVFMTDYAIQPNNDMIKLWNWLTDKACKFFWIDHHITAIQNLKHLNIPGLQITNKSACYNTFTFLNDPETPVPMCIRYASDFDIWNKNTEYSWEKQLYPLCYYIESLGTDINNNDSELVKSCKDMLTNNKYTDQFISIGKYIYKFIQNKYTISTKKIYSLLWNNFKCLLLNSSFNGSTQFEQYTDPQNEFGIKSFHDADIMISWSFDGKKYCYGIYSTNPKINCGQIAQQYLNGGGHKGAAGRKNR